MNAYQSPQRQPILLLTRRQRAALVVPAHMLDWLPCPLITPVSHCVEYGSHAHDPGCGTPLTLLVMRMPGVLVTIIESVRNE